MSKNLTGLLIDSTGIQKYIFSSNKLKLNLGASYIIEHLLMDTLLKKLITTYTEEARDNYCGWDLEESCPDLKGEKLGLAYAGGGRSLLFCKDQDVAESFAGEFSLEVMQYFPGITLSATTLEWKSDAVENNQDKEYFQNYLTAINKKLGSARSEHHIISSPLSPGYVRKDIYSDGYVDPEHSQKNNGKGVDLRAIENKNTSLGTLSKLKYAPDATKRHECDYLENNQDYSFPTEFEDVCMEKEQGFLAVVHIDGNGIGREFQKTGSLGDYKTLSDKVKEIGKETIHKTVKDLITLLTYPQHQACKSRTSAIIESFQKAGIKKLPFRPIISGGDDITFITDGHLGLYLAEKCIENFIDVTKEELGKEFHACAGVAIVKRKYPFARAYSLAEELIDNAKRSSRVPKDSDSNYSYIDMYVSKFGISGSLNYIRSQTHEQKEGNKTYQMNYGPYLVKSQNPDHKERPEFSNLRKKMARALGNASRSKVQGLRDVLYSTQKERGDFLKRLSTIDSGFAKKLGNELFDEKNKTPWIDAIDFMDFYPWDFDINESE